VDDNEEGMKQLCGGLSETTIHTESIVKKVRVTASGYLSSHCGGFRHLLDVKCRHVAQTSKREEVRLRSQHNARSSVLVRHMLLTLACVTSLMRHIKVAY
jgi:hypothetical protein